MLHDYVLHPSVFSFSGSPSSDVREKKERGAEAAKKIAALRQTAEKADAAAGEARARVPCTSGRISMHLLKSIH